MFKKFTAVAFTSVIAFGFTASPVHSTVQNSPPDAAIHLQNGQIYLNGKLIHKGFSITQNRFAYLYFYVPDRGLFTVSNRQFEGAMQQGTFNERELSFSVADLKVVLKSSSQILAEESSPAWIKFDPNFRLDLTSVMLGYGDKEKAPYEWPDQIRKNRN